MGKVHFLILGILGMLSLMGASFQASAQEEMDLEEAMRLEKSGNVSKALAIYDYIANDSTDTDFFRFYASLGKGRILTAKGDYRSAFDAYEEGIGIADRIGSDFIDGNNARFNLANLYTQFGKYDDAEKLLTGVQWKSGSEGARKSSALRASIAARHGDNLRALAIIDSVAPEFIDDNFNRAVLLQNRGYILRDLNRIEEAVGDFREATDLLSGTDKFVATSNLALALADLGKYEEALSHIDSAIAYFRSLGGNVSGDLAVALRKKGEILAKAEKKEEAYKAFKEFFDLDKKGIIAKLPQMSASTRLDYWTKEKPSLSKIFMLGDYDADILADVSLFRHQTSLMGMNDVAKLADNLTLDVKGIQKNLPANGVALQLVEYEAFPDDVRYAAIMTPNRGKSLFIPLFSGDFIHSKDELYPYSLYLAVTGENQFALNQLYTSRKMAEKVWKPIIEKLPKGVTDIYFTPEGIFHLWGIENMAYEPLNFYKLHRLSSMASLTDTAKGIVKDGESLVVGGLDYSDPHPLETERTYSEGKGVASKDQPIEYFSESHDRSASKALWEYVCPAEGTEIFQNLMWTGAEAEGVASLLPEPDKRNVLSEERLKSDIGRFRTIHIATHGYCLGAGMQKRPQMLQDSIAVDFSLLYSGLALSGANFGDSLPGEDGILSAREICNLDLSKADMIVLSACQTAKGMITDEGVSGLVRALKMAGAGSIIASLWEVEDTSTRLFMEEFYRNLAEGKSKREAFNTAREYLKNLKKTVSRKKFSASSMSGSKKTETREITPYAEPIYNAPFILID